MNMFYIFEIRTDFDNSSILRWSRALVMPLPGSLVYLWCWVIRTCSLYLRHILWRLIDSDGCEQGVSRRDQRYPELWVLHTELFWRIILPTFIYDHFLHYALFTHDFTQHFQFHGGFISQSNHNIKVTNLKNLQKIQIFEFCKKLKNLTRYTSSEVA